VHEGFTQVARRKEERFCDWVRNWARDIDEDPSPIVPRECCYLEALGVLSPTSAFGWSCAYCQSSMSLGPAMQPPRHAGFFRCSPLGMGAKSDTHLCSADQGLSRNASFSTLRNSDKGLMGVDQQ